MWLTVFTQRNFVADFLQVKCNFTRVNGRFAFLSAPFGVLVAAYYCHLRLIGKRVVDFPLALIELISLGVTADTIENRRFARTESVWPKISGTRGRFLSTILRVEKPG